MSPSNSIDSGQIQTTSTAEMPIGNNTVAQFIGQMHEKIAERYAKQERKISEDVQNALREHFLMTLRLTTSVSFQFTTEAFPKPMKVAFIMRRILEFLEPMLPPEPMMDVQIALEEIVANIVEHSYTLEEQGDIAFQFTIAPTKVVIDVDDYGEQGRKFNLERAGKFTSLEELRREGAKQRGGMGVYLIRQVVDEVHYSSVPGKYNRMTITKLLR